MRVARVFLAGFCFAYCLSLPSYADALLSVSPALSTVGVGDSFAIDVNIAGVTDLYSYQFDISFNPAVLNVTNSLVGSFLSVGGATYFIPGMIDNTNGDITFTAETLLTAISGVSGDGTLAVFDFTGIAPGTSDLTIDDNANLILTDSTGALINGTQTGGSVTVQGASAVPEPGPFMLIGAGIIALLKLRKLAAG